MTTLARADYMTLWSLGVWDGDPQNEYSNSNDASPAPGSATLLDDDFYFAGSYPAPIGTVAVSEPTANLEDSLNTWNTTMRFHFPLSAAQATSTARIRLNFHQCWGGWWHPVTGDSLEGYGMHGLKIRWNGTLISTQTVTYQGTVVVEANAGTFSPVVGENVLEISRALPPESSPNGALSPDALSLEIDPTALVDGDEDGLPRWWEQDHQLSDGDATDAALDLDQDGLSNLQEFARQTRPRDEDSDEDGLRDGVETDTGVFVSLGDTGTDPLKADSDDDSLSDGEESRLNPRPNPHLRDSDADGREDAWEVRTGYDPTSPASLPPVFDAAIGIQFASELHPRDALPSSAVAGLVPQSHWNHTWPLTSWRNPQGSHLDIAGPVEDALVSSSGSVTAMTMTWSNAPPGEYGGAWASGNGGSATGRLLGGYLNASSSRPLTLSFQAVPYPVYDLMVYVGSVYDGARARVRVNGEVLSERRFISASTRPQDTLIEPLISSTAKPWRGNVIRFRGLTTTTAVVELIPDGNHEAGIHAIQFVNMSTDTDGDGLPDAWEFSHRLRADLADATADVDGDGLNHSGEWARHSDPQRTDTDGDGLSDLVETGTGNWVSAMETGTNPRIADTDEDGLTDGEELRVQPHATSPLLADTDGDGRSDAEEVRLGSDPTTSDAATAGMPILSTSPHQFVWQVENVQMVWDHRRGQVAEGTWRSGDLMSISLVNAANPGTDAFYTNLHLRDGRMTYYFHSNPAGAFSDPGDDNSGIWDSDWNSPPTDRRAALGFSGYGPADISDRLRFRLEGSSSGSSTDWNLLFTITNQDTGVTVISRSFNGCAAASSVHDGSATWQDRRDPSVSNRLQLWTHDGVRLFFQATPLEDTPAFAVHRDSDDDGMPDAWESSHGVSSATADADSDGLSNLREYLAGTDPQDADSDNDLAGDGIEVLAASDPLQAGSRPPLQHGLPAGVMGEDLNGNGMADAWEQWAGSFQLQALLDSDSDGMTNGEEAEAGTDPMNPQSRLWADAWQSGSELILRWPLLRHKQHRVWQSGNLQQWTPTTGSPVAVGEEYQQAFGGLFSGPPTFFAARVQDMDTDLDGVSDWTEANVLGSSTTAANSTRSTVPVDANQDGQPETSYSGDYATLVEHLQGASANGGFPGGGGAGIVSQAQAARFLMQAAFGPTPEDIRRVQQLGYAGWISEQQSKPPTRHSTYIRAIYDDIFSQRAGGGYNRGGEVNDPFLFGNNLMTAFARAAIQGEDQLRQRVAFALSQILVASRRDANLENRCLGMADFYDIFVRHAFGNYRDVLQEVTMHPVMGRYLSHVGNQKADPSINRYPDENYARELMQLFTVGLWELNPDGSRQLDAGQPIPTYGNAEITQLARVMTGFWFSGHHWGGGGWTEQDYATPMQVHASRHDFGAKTLLRGSVIPARAATQENAEKDVRDALGHLFQHPNTGVFIGRQLIQFLVTDNPSPAYVQRVGQAFADNGSGQRGDLGAVVRAILLDGEARDPRFTDSPDHGRLKEPVIRAMALGRAFGMKQVPQLLWWDWNDFFNDSRQEPTYSPSVFNFYRPDYRAPGLLTQQDKAGPVFQITDSYSSISFPNRLWNLIENGFSQWETYRFPLDLAREVDLAATPERLVDHLNVIFCAGRMTPTTRSLILNAISQIPVEEASARARVAAYLAIVAPEGAVMK